MWEGVDLPLCTPVFDSPSCNMKGEGKKEEAGRWYNSVAALWFVVLNCGAVDGWLVGTQGPEFLDFAQKQYLVY